MEEEDWFIGAVVEEESRWIGTKKPFPKCLTSKRKVTRRVR